MMAIGNLGVIAPVTVVPAASECRTSPLLSPICQDRRNLSNAWAYGDVLIVTPTPV